MIKHGNATTADKEQGHYQIEESLAAGGIAPKKGSKRTVSQFVSAIVALNRGGGSWRGFLEIEMIICLVEGIVPSGSSWRYDIKILASSIFPSPPLRTEEKISRLTISARDH